MGINSPTRLSFFNKQNERPTQTLDTAPIAYALMVGDVLAEVNEYARKHIGMGPGDDIRQFYGNLEQWNILVKSADQNKQTMLSMKMKTGEVHRFLCNLATADYKQERAYILWGIDIEELAAEKAHAHMQCDANGKATEANLIKGKILTDMANQIRTPVNSIIGMTDLLLGEKITGRQLQYVTDIKKSAESLLDTANIVLDYANIREGKMQISPVDIEMGAFLKNIVSMIRFSARAKGLQFIDEVNIKSPEYVNVDDVHLKQVLVHLLSNAIKFTKSGKVVFFVEIAADNILFKISDTGTGFKPEEIPLLFSAFDRTDERKTPGAKEIGLGLPISKELIDMMGGKIWLESKYGVGSHFYVTIPYVPGDEAGVKTEGVEFEYIYAPTANILLVDDIQTNLTVTAGLLHLCGITADVAMSGIEAINLVREKDYDIIFMDYMMPEMDGVEAMKIIRGLGEKYTELPVIALTAGAVGESRDFLLGAGMNDFLGKPLEKNTLMSVLKKWLPANKIESVENRNTADQNEVYSGILQAVSLIEGLDIQLALNRLSGMQNVLERSLIQVSGSIGEYLRKMDEQLSRNNLKDFSVMIHGIKGALANIGAVRHSELAAELEILSKAGNMPQCAEKFVMFADIMSGLETTLNAIFLQVDAIDLPQGDRSLLTQKAKTAVSFLEEYEIVEARKCIDEMLNFTYGEATDKLLRDISGAMAKANYKNAIAILKNNIL